jgi:DNA-binding NtrC family response regulator
LRNRLDRPDVRFTNDDAELLKSYDWPGNVRELQNVIERAMILAKGTSLRLDLALAHSRPTPSPSIDGGKGRYESRRAQRFSAAKISSNWNATISLPAWNARTGRSQGGAAPPKCWVSIRARSRRGFAHWASREIHDNPRKKTNIRGS